MKTNMDNLIYEHERVQLEVVTQAVRAILDDYGLPNENYELSVVQGFKLEQVGRDMALHLTRRIPKETVAHFHIKYPKNWKEAFKERWFPNWLLKKFPVKYNEVKYDVEAFYDKVSLPDKQPYVVFHKVNMNKEEN